MNEPKNTLSENQMADEETLREISKSEELIDRMEKYGFFPFDYLFQENVKITSREIIRSYGNRVKELCAAGKNGKKITYEELAKVCDVSVQTISNIVNGNIKSVNIAYCNALAKYFECSAYYILGVTDWKNGILVDAKPFRVPIFHFETQEVINITAAAQWAYIDPALFKLLEQLFHADSATRKTVRETLELILEHSK